MCTLNFGPVLRHRLLSCIKYVAWRKTSEKVHILLVCSQLQCSRWIDLHPGLHFSNLDPQVCECVRVCGWDSGYVLVWVEYWAVCEGVFVSCSGRKWEWEEVMKGESRGRWDTLMMLILALSHRWYEWFLFGWSSSRTPGVLLSFRLLFIYLPILSPDPPPPPHIFLNTTTTLLFWLPC